jgi:hypothetical protein
MDNDVNKTIEIFLKKSMIKTQGSSGMLNLVRMNMVRTMQSKH